LHETLKSTQKAYPACIEFRIAVAGSSPSLTYSMLLCINYILQLFGSPGFIMPIVYTLYNVNSIRIYTERVGQSKDVQLPLLATDCGQIALWFWLGCRNVLDFT